ncbi:MAG: hypothetical protein PHI86_06615 [Candidatus Omnitrophica bacterium]|nr:hypothetical protein [Candidatus Omnitrophota bacterium]
MKGLKCIHFKNLRTPKKAMIVMKNQIEKQPDMFLMKWHRKINFDELKENLEDGFRWFKMESAIFHIGCRNIESAQKLLKFARSIGFKRSGIIESEKRVVVEVSGTEKIDAPVNNKLSRDYIEKLIDEANLRIERNTARVNVLKKYFQDYSKTIPA